MRSHLETSKVDLSSYVTLNTAQNIQAPKSFYNNVANNTLPLRIQGFANATWGLEMDKDFGRLHIKYAGVSGTTLSNVTNHYTLDNAAFFPATSGGKDLGTSSYTWKDIYTSGNLMLTNSNSNKKWKVGESDNGTINFAIDNNTGSYANMFAIQYGSFVPLANGKDLGYNGGTQRWHDIYLSNAVYIHGTNDDFRILQSDDWSLNFQKTSQGGSEFYTLFYAALGTFYTQNHDPMSSGNFDLGENTFKWRDLWLSRNLTDGTNTVSIAQIAKKVDVPLNQTTMAIVVNALTNINGWELTAYEATLGTTNSYVTYTITYGGSTVTEAQAKTYMKAMTGSEFLPTYDYNIPQNTYLMFADKTIWKPQFDAINGLILYKMADLTSVSDYGIATEQEVLAILQGGNS